MKALTRIIGGLMLMALALPFVSCSDNVDDSNIYTFTGDMITGYLEKSDSFKLYSYVLRKVKLSEKSKSTFADLLSARGNYTVFAPTDDAMHHLLDSIYNQTDFPVEQIEDSVAERIVRCSILDSKDGDAYRMADFNEGTMPITNADDRYMTVRFDTINGSAVTQINGDAVVISPDHELENGYIHMVNRVVLLSNAYICNLIENASNTRIFSMLLQQTGWSDKLTEYRDEEYEKRDLPEKYTGEPNWSDIIPQHRYIGYTVLLETDSVFHEKWGIEMPVVEAGVITNSERIMEQIRQKCAEAYPQATAEALTDSTNAVNEFVAYHLLPARVPFNWLVVHRTEYGYSYKNATRLSINCDNFWETMSSPHRRMIKMTEGPTTDGIRLNRYSTYNRDTYSETSVQIPGIGIKSNNGDFDNNALNGFYYPIDDILVYSNDVSGKALNQRIRMDLSTYYPELVTNGLFIKEGQNGIYLPSGYVKYLTLNAEETDYHYLTGYNCGWNDMYCDEHNVTGQYDFTLRLPPVPFDGSWEVRLVYSYSSNRGMAQLYFGTDKNNLQAHGLPIDERIQVDNPLIGWALYDNEDPDLNRERDRTMRNHGYMMGCKHEGPSTGGTVSTTLYNVRSEHRLRKIFYTGNLYPDQTYYIRFKSVLANTSTMFVLDYVEFAPKNVYNGVTEEDAW
jgi:hypothetical protein